MERARAIDTAWISTIHRFCLRILRANAFDAGLDPRFAVADEVGARLLRSEAFDIALERFLGGAPPDDGGRRLDLLAAYGRRRLRETLSDVHEQLRSAGRPLELRPHAVAELAPALAAAEGAAAGLDHERAARLTALLATAPGPAALTDLSAYKIRNTAGRQDYNAAREGLEAAALDAAAVADLGLLEELLGLLDAAYAERKDGRSLVDFTDLELRTRDLLTARPDLAEAYRERFACVLVDEFQDTNRLQVELIDLIAGGELFLVGDEFQSIYRFRHADVDVYRTRREAAGAGLIALRRNYRSRPHVIGTVNESYRREFPERYEPLLAEGAFDGDPPGGGRVDLLLTDKVAFRAAGQSWRDVEARALAARIAELVDGGECRPGQVVMLFEAGTDAARYEAALRDRHLQTVRATGRGYYAQQQVSDVLAYLRLIRNRYDDVALLTVLASPLVGMSNDGLWRVRRAAIRRPIFTALERDEPPPGPLAGGAAAGAGVRAAVRAARAGLGGGVARAAVRPDRGRARLRPGLPGHARRRPPLRQPAQARPAGGRVRGRARPRPGGVRALLRRAGRTAGARGRGGHGRGGPRRHRAHDRPCGEGARVRRGRPGRLRPRAGLAAHARHPGRFRRPHRPARGRSRHGPAAALRSGTPTWPPASASPSARRRGGCSTWA